MLLELDQISKRFSTEGPWILEGASLSLKKGEGVVIRGRSGCGKTTLLNIIAGLETPTKGDVLFQGKNLRSLNEREKASLRNVHIGYCLQTAHFLNHFSVLENLIVPLVLRGENIQTSRVKGENVLDQLDLKAMAHVPPASLSGGQLQRLSLGRSLIGEPDLLLVDEPTGNLDETTAKRILELILDYHRQKNASLVLVSHDPINADLKRICLGANPNESI